MFHNFYRCMFYHTHVTTTAITATLIMLGIACILTVLGHINKSNTITTIGAVFAGASMLPIVAFFICHLIAVL